MIAEPFHLQHLIHGYRADGQLGKTGSESLDTFFWKEDLYIARMGCLVLFFVNI